MFRDTLYLWGADALYLLRQAAGYVVLAVAKIFVLPHIVLATPALVLALMKAVHDLLIRLRCVVANHRYRTDDFFDTSVTYCQRCGQPDDETRAMVSEYRRRAEPADRYAAAPEKVG